MHIATDGVTYYKGHLCATLDWLQQSFDRGQGGSSAHYSPISGWSAPYPETTGYIIPTLIEASRHLSEPRHAETAADLGKWLLSLQANDGWWPAGLHAPTAKPQPSVFNTAQIVDGMVALAEFDGDGKWGTAAAKAATWLANGVAADGLWPLGNYRAGFNPSYYTQVAWPMLRSFRMTGDTVVEAAARRVLSRILALRQANGTIADWGFRQGAPAFTHTIAYTLRGALESAILLDDWETFGQPITAALEKFVRLTEFSNGRLSGTYDENWRGTRWYTCLTGNAQIALCLMRFEEREPDLRLVNAAAKLVDHVCSCQSIASSNVGRRGAVAGSAPIWGRYMTLRYPNWAAKYHADALMMLRNRLQAEVAT